MPHAVLLGMRLQYTLCAAELRPLRQHDSTISTTSEASLQEQDGSMLTTS